MYVSWQLKSNWKSDTISSVNSNQEKTNTKEASNNDTRFVQRILFDINQESFMSLVLLAAKDECLPVSLLTFLSAAEEVQKIGLKTYFNCFISKTKSFRGRIRMITSV